MKHGRMITSVRTIIWSRIFRFWSKRRCWGAPLEIFKSNHSLQYWSDWTETSYDNTRHQSAQSLWAGFLRCKGRGSEFKKFLQTSFVHVPLSCGRKNFHLLDLRDYRCVGSALFSNDNRYFVPVSMCKSVESTTILRIIFSDFPWNKRY